MRSVLRTAASYGSRITLFERIPALGQIFDGSRRWTFAAEVRWRLSMPKLPIASRSAESSKDPELRLSAYIKMTSGTSGWSSVDLPRQSIQTEP